MENQEYSRKFNLPYNNSAINDFNQQPLQHESFYDEPYNQNNFYYNYSEDYFHNGIQLNPRQTFWIRRRKLRRDALDASMIEQSKNYTHESRHRHAMKRLRAPSGRFLTKEESTEFLNNIEKTKNI